MNQFLAKVKGKRQWDDHEYV